MEQRGGTESTSTVYQSWDDGFVVRRMTSRDGQQVIQWYSDICPTSVDLQVALQIRDETDPDGDGFYVGDLDGKTVASKVEVPVCDGIRYGSLFYVTEQLRKSGFGRRINDIAGSSGDRRVEDGGKDGNEATRVGGIVCIDAHDELEAMNHRRGYKTAFKLTQFEGEVLAELHGGRSGTNIQQVNNSTLDDVIVYDDKCFVRPGSDWRRRMLSKWTNITGSRSVFARRQQNGDIVGYGCRRPAAQVTGHQLIGPLYADSLDIAWDLLVELTRDVIGQTIWINITEPNKNAVQLVNELQLKPCLHMLRMHRHGDPQELNDRVFAVTSIDICGF